MGDILQDLIQPDEWMDFDSNIKAIGVGGGGCNAINYMYNQKIDGCTFIACNTDKQVLDVSNVPLKIQMGRGLGAGCNPTEGRNAALETQELIEKIVFTENTDMLFITAGMGGGTGTGAAPVIAKMAKDRKILTVAVVTIPFKLEGNDNLSRAIDGIRELEKHVDSLLLINNENLYEHYGNSLIHEAFPMVDEILATAVRGITGIIKESGYINIDFKDVKAMMSDSGMALLGCGIGEGDHRVKDAVDKALKSPLLNNLDLKTAKNTLVNITVNKNLKGIIMTELNSINTYIQEHTGFASNFKTGIVWDNNPEFDGKVKITVIATGFKMERLSDITDITLGNIIEITEDFVHNSILIKKGEIDLGNDIETIRIGPSSHIGSRTFYYNEDSMPILATVDKTNIAELENIPAIKRNNKGEF